MPYILIVVTIAIALISALLQTTIDDKPKTHVRSPLLKKPTQAGAVLIVLTAVSGTLSLFSTYKDAKQKDTDKAALTKSNDELRADLKVKTDLMTGLILGHQTQNPQAKLTIRTDLIPKYPNPGVKPESYQFLMPVIFPKVIDYAAKMATPAELTVVYANLDAPVRNPFDEVSSDAWEATYFFGPEKSFGLSKLGNVGRAFGAKVNLRFVPPAPTGQNEHGNWLASGFGLDFASIDLDDSISSALLYKDREESSMTASFALYLQHKPSDGDWNSLVDHWKKHFRSASIWLLIDEPSSICAQIPLKQEVPALQQREDVVDLRMGWAIASKNPEIKVCPSGLFFTADTYKKNKTLLE